MYYWFFDIRDLYLNKLACDFLLEGRDVYRLDYF